MELSVGLPLHGTYYVCLLNTSIYGLKQASKVWFEKLAFVLLDIDFTQSIANYSMFLYNNNDTFVIALVRIYDILFTRSSSNFITHTKTVIHDIFIIKDLGLAKYYLGLAKDLT